MSDDKDIEHGFSLPPGYDDSLARRLANRMACMEEVREYRILYEKKGAQPFVVPENYFNATLEVQALHVVVSMDTGNASIVPPGYFDENTDLLHGLAVIASKEGKESGFIRPEGYDEAAAKSTVLLLNEKKAKVVHLGRLKRWAVAALLTLVIGAWLFRVYKTPSGQDCGTLACLEKRDVLKSGEVDVLNEEELLQLVDDEELENSLMEGGSEVEDSTSAQMEKEKV